MMYRKSLGVGAGCGSLTVTHTASWAQHGSLQGVCAAGPGDGTRTTTGCITGTIGATTVRIVQADGRGEGADTACNDDVVAMADAEVVFGETPGG